MTVSVNAQGIIRTRAEEFDDFSVCKVHTNDGGVVNLFLPLGKSQAVADAINAAIAKDATE